MIPSPLAAIDWLACRPWRSLAGMWCSYIGVMTSDNLGLGMALLAFMVALFVRTVSHSIKELSE